MGVWICSHQLSFYEPCPQPIPPLCPLGGHIPSHPSQIQISTQDPTPQPQLSLVVMVLEAGGPQLVPRRARTVTWYS